MYLKAISLTHNLHAYSRCRWHFTPRIFNVMYWLCCVLFYALLFAHNSGTRLQPIALPPTILNDSCANLNQVIQSLAQSTEQLLDQFSARLDSVLNLGSSAQFAASSCSDIAATLPNNISGYYWILSSANVPIRVYCDLVKVLCGQRGWTRVAYLNMNDPTPSCPSAWYLNAVSNTSGLCGRPQPSTAGCFSVNYPVNGVLYSKICGWVRGYNYKTNDGFFRYGCSSPCQYTAIDQPYLDGVSITRKSPSRQHVWSYVTANVGGGTCPCYPGGSYANSIPSFVGSNWYCQGQVAGSSTTDYYKYPLWTGAAACVGYTQAPCCSNPNLPWFSAVMTSQVVDDLEVRICSDQSYTDEDTRLQNVELYVS